MSKVAIVTGSGQGIGVEIARQLLAQRMKVVFAEQNTALNKGWQDIPNLRFKKTDVTSEAFVKAMIAKTIKDFGNYRKNAFKNLE